MTVRILQPRAENTVMAALDDDRPGPAPLTAPPTAASDPDRFARDLADAARAPKILATVLGGVALVVAGWLFDAIAGVFLATTFALTAVLVLAAGEGRDSLRVVHRFLTWKGYGPPQVEPIN